MVDTRAHITRFLAQWMEAGVDETSIRRCMTWLGDIEDFNRKKPKIYGYRPCVEFFKNMAILSDGTAVPCCMDAHGQLTLGNVNEQEIKDIWYGTKYIELRRQHLEGKVPKNSICHGCYNTWITSRLEQIELSFPFLHSALRQSMGYARCIAAMAPDKVQEMYRITEKRLISLFE